MKLTHISFVSSPAGGAASGPKMLSKSAIEGFLPSASVDTSETQIAGDQSEGCVWFTQRDKTWQTDRQVNRQREAKTESWR